jgi:hypothetical protein
MNEINERRSWSMSERAREHGLGNISVAEYRCTVGFAYKWLLAMARFPYIGSITVPNVNKESRKKNTIVKHVPSELVRSFFLLFFAIYTISNG